MIRTFIALEIPEEALEKIVNIKNQLINDYEKLKWEPLNKLHLTLKFLGDTEENIVPNICSEIEKLLKNYDILNLSFQKFGLFIKDKKPRILWIGLNDNDKLIKLANEIDELISKFGYLKEKRKFTPHITLLRIKDKDEKFYKDFYKLTEVEIPEINFNANKITFFKSTLLKSGSVYEPLKSFYIKNKGE
ncbi:RNA 2',3'-cyclic phosphodiesterase [Rosettibacter firmus]|uniref:RNA 2',3'-cyclic phosphodiesterase n=1 Tax=Rosettibacter firmus TaxID=3111522 RepID=UPI00336C2DE1